MRTKIQANMPTAIKVAKAIASMRKNNFVSVGLLKNKLDEQGVICGKDKLYRMWRYLVNNKTIKKVSRSEFHWNGSLAIWEDPDKANAYCLQMLKESKTGPIKIEPVRIPSLASIDAKFLVDELRARGWQVKCSKQTITVVEL